MKALVIGGSSYVGNVLLTELIKNKDSVIASYNQNISDNTDTSINWVKIDITDKDDVKKLLNFDFDIIFHIASLPGDTGDPQEMVRVNINGLQNILDLALEKKVKKFVLSSSVSAMGWYPPDTKFEKPDYLPVDEKHPCRPKDMYAATKNMQEILAFTYYHQYKLPLTALRLTLVIGTEGRGGGALWKEFAISMKEGKEIQLPVFSTSEIQHFVDIRDVAKMHIAAAENEKSTGEIFNCCGPEPFTGEEFRKIIEDLCPGIKIKLDFPYSISGGDKLYFDMRKAEELLDFKPKYKLADSMKYLKMWIDN